MKETFTIRREFHIINETEFTLPDGYTWDDVKDFSVSGNTLAIKLNTADGFGVTVNMPLPDNSVESPNINIFEEDIGIYDVPIKYTNDADPIATYDADFQVANMGNDDDDE